MADFQLNVKLNGVEQAVSTVGELEAALKATRAELKNVEKDSAAFDQLSNQARTLQKELKDVKEATNFDQNLGQLTESVGRLASTVTSGFAAASAAVTIFGGDTEELTKEQIKAQQLLTLSLSAVTIATNAAKIAEDARNVGLLLQRGLIAAVTAVTGAQTVATTAQTGATVGATVAQRALNAAMAANPIGLLITAVGALVGALVLFGDSEDEAKKYTVNLNEEMERQTKSIDDNIKKKVELAKITARLNSIGKSDIERLQIEKDLQAQLSDLSVESLENQKELAKNKLTSLQGELELSTTFVKYQMDQQKKLQDFNVESRFNAEQKAIASLIREKEMGLITSEEYYTGLIKIQQKYFTYVDDEQKKEFEDRNKNFFDLIQQLNAINGQIDVANQDKIAKEKEANEKILQEQREAYKKRKEALEQYNKDVEKLNKDRVEAEKDIQRQLQDFELERISLVKGFDGVYREDLIAGYTETIEKLKVERDRSVEDAKLKYDEDIKNFRESELKRLGDTKATRDKIDADVKALDEKFKQEQLDREKSFNQQIEIIQLEKNAKIIEIDTILNNEIAFGDNSLADSKKQIALDEINFKVEMADREIALARKNRLELIKIRQDLQMEQIKAEREVILQQLEIERQESLKNVQGTEEQKGIQRENINKLYNDKISQANEDFRLREKEAEKAAADEILAYKLQKAEEYAGFAIQGANSIVSLISAVNDGARQEEEQKINEQYSKEQDALNRSLNAGLITREQYDKQNAALDARRQKAEYEAKKKAFEQEKKLRIAQAIIAGAQGALSAFTGAMQLGPIAGPIVGGVLAALVVAATAVQVANISKQKFDGGAVPVTPIEGGAGAAVNTGSDAVQQGSSGGFTGFTPNLTGGGATSPGGTPTGSGPSRVYVVESDITDTQNRVRAYETNATF